MKKQWYKGWQITTILLATAALGLAQTQPSTQANVMPPPGAVNYVEGQVSVNGQTLSPQATRSTVLQPNQRIDTGQGYAEVLLTPGTFLRIGHDSEVQMLSAGLADTRVGLLHGSAMIESDQIVKGQDVAVVMNGATAQIEQKGLYDFNTNQDTVRVLDGKLKVSENDRNTTLKKGDEVLLASAKPLKREGFEVKAAENDPLYAWSKVRSQEEAEANLNTAQTVIVNGGWYGPGWYWDPYWSFWSFVPGGWGALYSPFGWGFYSPGFVWASPAWRYGYLGHGFVGGRYYAHAHAFHGGMSGFHAAGGFHGGGFHGGGFHAGGFGGRR
jgi:hypothetical protein